MRKSVAGIVMVVCVIGMSAPAAFAGGQEWEDAGKVLAVMEGLRVLTGGNVDVIGGVTGIHRNNVSALRFEPVREVTRVEHHYYAKPASRRYWVPRYTTRKEYVPRHEEYHPKYGTVIVDGHYIEYKVEDGGYWEYERTRRYRR